MSTKNYLLALSIAALVSACGGSSSEGTQGGNGSSTETADKTKIKFDAVLKSQYCSEGPERPLANVAVILHSADGKVHSRYATDANGHFEINWPAGVTHVTTFWKTANNYSFINTEIAPAHGDLGKMSYLDDDKSTCNCKTITLDSADLKTTMPEYKLYRHLGSGLDSGRVNQSMHVIEACADASKKFGVLQLMLAPKNSGPSYSREIELANVADQSTIKLNISDFKQHGRVVTVTSNLPISNTSTFSAGPTGRDFYIRSVPGIDGPQRVFDRGAQQQFVYAASSNTDDVPQGSMFYVSARRTQLDATASAIQIPLPENKVALTVRMQQLLTDILAGNASNVDFSGINNYQTLDMYNFGANYRWNLQSASKATIPALQLPTDIQNGLDQGSSPTYQMELAVVNPAWSYGTIQQKQAAGSRGKISADLYAFTIEFLELSVNP